MTVYYWQGIAGCTELFAPYQTKIQQLREGHYKALSLEELNTQGEPPIYSIRVNKKIRILFTVFEGQLLLLNVLKDHKYKRNPFIRHKAVLRQFLNKAHESEPVLADEDDEHEEAEFQPCSSIRGLNVEPDSAEDSSLRLAPEAMVPLYPFQQQLITLNARQQDALQARLPAIVRGPAGSGKSCVGFTALVQELKKGGVRKPLYVSQSARLVRQMQLLWEELAALEGLEPNAVEFMTYEDLFRAHVVGDLPMADEAHFKAWYSEVTQRDKPGQERLSADLVWREFRIRSGLTEQAYYDLGGKQSKLDDASRRWLSELYTHYLTHLGSDYFSPELHEFTKRLPYTLIIVDEAQDLSTCQLRNLYRAAARRNILYFLGDHQILYDGKSRLLFLKDLLYQSGITIDESRVLSLPITYRSAPEIIHIANTLIQLKYDVTGGAADKGEAAVIETCWTRPETGVASWIKPSELEGYLASIGKLDASTAVITSPEHMDEARARFPLNEIVYDWREVKGLQFERVIFYQPLHDSQARAIAKKGSITSKSHRGLPKDGDGDDTHIAFFDALITAVTRAKRELNVVQEESHQLKPLIARLKPAFIAEQTVAATSTPSVKSEATIRAEWEAQAIELLWGEQDHEQRVRDILVHHLGYATQEAVDAWLHRHRQQASHKVTPQASNPSTDRGAASSSGTVGENQQLTPQSAKSKPTPKHKKRPQPVRSNKTPRSAPTSAPMSVSTATSSSGATPTEPTLREQLANAQRLACNGDFESALTQLVACGFTEEQYRSQLFRWALGVNRHVQYAMLFVKNVVDLIGLLRMPSESFAGTQRDEVCESVAQTKSMFPDFVQDGDELYALMALPVTAFSQHQRELVWQHLDLSDTDVTGYDLSLLLALPESQLSPGQRSILWRSFQDRLRDVVRLPIDLMSLLALSKENFSDAERECVWTAIAPKLELLFKAGDEEDVALLFAKSTDFFPTTQRNLVWDAIKASLRSYIPSLRVLTLFLALPEEHLTGAQRADIWEILPDFVHYTDDLVTLFSLSYDVFPIEQRMELITNLKLEPLDRINSDLVGRQKLFALPKEQFSDDLREMLRTKIQEVNVIRDTALNEIRTSYQDFSPQQRHVALNVLGKNMPSYIKSPQDVLRFFSLPLVTFPMALRTRMLQGLQPEQLVSLVNDTRVLEQLSQLPQSLYTNEHRQLISQAAETIRLAVQGARKSILGNMPTSFFRPSERRDRGSQASGSSPYTLPS